ncbi:unnamed protein product [Ilex paraguariensis]|uniref:Uncharacterized protein n=1 Tax=Ilex paraguariensis TaxID=185542 RepID=A0ABC8RMS3_9AQUA
MGSSLPEKPTPEAILQNERLDNQVDRMMFSPSSFTTQTRWRSRNHSHRQSNNSSHNSTNYDNSNSKPANPTIANNHWYHQLRPQPPLYLREGLGVLPAPLLHKLLTGSF